MAVFAQILAIIHFPIIAVLAPMDTQDKRVERVKGWGKIFRNKVLLMFYI